jgi:hypothetical protein
MVKNHWGKIILHWNNIKTSNNYDIIYKHMFLKFFNFKLLPIFLSYYWCSPLYGTNIGTAFLKDKDFEQEFVKEYGEVYYVLRNQIAAWLDVLAYKNISLKQLEIIFNMEIPMTQRKKFFKILESIIIKLDQVNVQTKDKFMVENKRDQLMIKIYHRYKKFYNPHSISWHIKNNYINTNTDDRVYQQGNLAPKLSYFLVSQCVLSSSEIKFFHENWEKLLPSQEKNWNNIIYGLILKYATHTKKLQEIMDNYPINTNQKKFIEFLIKPHGCPLNRLIQNYKSNHNTNHDHQSHEILIILIKFIINNRKNPAISDQEWIHVFKIISSYYCLIFTDLKGVGLSNFFKAMKLLLYKQMSSGLVINTNHSLKNFIQYLENNYHLIVQYIQEETLNPYFIAPIHGDTLLEDMDKSVKIYKKNYSKKTGYIVEFFSIFNVINIIYKNFNQVVKWAPIMYILSANNHQYHHEQSVYFLTLSYIELMAHMGKNTKNYNERLLVRWKENLDFWTHRIKKTGQVSIYGQFIADKFAQGHRSNNYFAYYMNNIYHQNHPNTIKRPVDIMDNFTLKSKDYGKSLAKYDWFMLLGIYVLHQEKTDITVEKNIIIKDNRKYQKIINNKYSINRNCLYQWDYIVKNLSSKSLQSISLMGKILILMAMKKYRYMIMLGDAVEHKTGVSTCFTIHPFLPFLSTYAAKDVDLGLLSALARKETGFTLLVDGRHNNSFSLSSGAGLFQVNFANAKNIASKFQVKFSSEQLQLDIKYNFFVVINFLIKLKEWLANKNIINWIVSYNAPIKILRLFESMVANYKIPVHNEEIRTLYSPLVISLIPSYITRHYALHVLSYWGNNNYFLSNDYVNLFMTNTNGWF